MPNVNGKKNTSKKSAMKKKPDNLTAARERGVSGTRAGGKILPNGSMQKPMQSANQYLMNPKKAVKKVMKLNRSPRRG